MRLPGYLAAFIGLLGLGTVSAVMHYALDENCQLFISPDAASLKDSIRDYSGGKKAEMNCKNAYIAYSPPVVDESSLFVFLPKTDTQLYVYGHFLFTSTEDVVVDVGQEFELIDFTRNLGRCKFVQEDFVAFVDRNLIHLLVDCNNRYAFIISQAVSYLRTVWTPLRAMVTMKLKSTLKTSKFAAIPASIDNVLSHPDSLIVGYEIAADTASGYGMPLHRIRQGLQQKVTLNLPPNAHRVYFVDALTMVVQDTGSKFYTYNANDDDHSVNSVFLDFAKGPIFDFTPEKKICYYGRAAGVDNTERTMWKYRVNIDPTVDERFGEAVDCGFDKLSESLDTCKKNVKSRKKTHIAMYCLMAFEFVIILATLAIFTLCVFKQRKRRKRHHEKKKNKRARKGNKGAKTDDAAPSTNNPSSTKNSDKP